MAVLVVILALGAGYGVAWFCTAAIRDLGRGKQQGYWPRAGAQRTAWPERDDEAGAA